MAACAVCGKASRYEVGTGSRIVLCLKHVRASRAEYRRRFLSDPEDVYEYTINGAPRISGATILEWLTA